MPQDEMHNAEPAGAGCALGPPALKDEVRRAFRSPVGLTSRARVTGRSDRSRSHKRNPVERRASRRLHAGPSSPHRAPRRHRYPSERDRCLRFESRCNRLVPAQLGGRDRAEAVGRRRSGRFCGHPAPAMAAPWQGRAAMASAVERLGAIPSRPSVLRLVALGGATRSRRHCRSHRRASREPVATAPAIVSPRAPDRPGSPPHFSFANIGPSLWTRSVFTGPSPMICTSTSSSMAPSQCTAPPGCLA